LKPRSLKGRILLAGVLSFLSFACQTPPAPPEAAEAERLERSLWSAGASLFAPEEYEAYRAKRKAGRDLVSGEEAKFGWFRDYGTATKALRSLLQSGNDLLSRIRDLRASREDVLTSEIRECARQASILKDMTGYFNENSTVRNTLTRANIQLSEAEMLVGKAEFDKARILLENGRRSIVSAQEAAARVLNRYLDERQLAKWKMWVGASILESKTRGVTVFVISKLERRLHVYRNGQRTASFEIGLGRYGLSDKRYSGDDATPEGRYKIVRKYPNGSFYKALLIDYPNEEDQATFARGKRAGTIPRQAVIGGAIEIHGGGKDSLTRGCVGLENKDMDAVFEAAAVGTPVTIVGTLVPDNPILTEVRKFLRR
jgi:L,D-peptidoglycan transpeptidase YkuD (ErfK/YbiS/YcfS/YnhG family)